MVSLRQRNKQNAMRLAQRTALDLFEQHGFDSVTVEQVAAETGMAASTIYRHFGSKEALVLWDEHESGIDEALETEFDRRPPWDAMRTAFANELGGRYDDDLDFQLRRITYVYATEQIHGAAIEDDVHDQAELAEALEQLLSEQDRSAAPLIAGAAMLALDVAFDRWQQAQAARPLGVEITTAFDQLAALASFR